MNAALALAIAAAVAAPLLGYITASRRLSGKIGTSDAEALWTESRAIRDDYRGQLVAANQRIVSVEGRLAESERANSKCATEYAALLARFEALELENTSLRDQVQSLHERLDEERAK